MLTPEEVSTFRVQGFLPSQPMLPDEETAELCEACIRTCGVEWENPGRRQATNRLKPYLLFRWAADLVRHPAILDRLEALVGPNILVFHTTVWFKEPHSQKAVPWHQDATYFGLSPFEHVTAWVALTPSTEEMGCVQIVPGSQVWGQLRHADKPNPDLMLSRGQTLAKKVDERDAVNLIMKPGDVSFHHTLAVHRSQPNNTDHPRIGIGISYIPTRVRHVGQTRLSATLVRGTDNYGHFDLEPELEGSDSLTAVEIHADSIGRFQKASESIPEMGLVH